MPISSSYRLAAGLDQKPWDTTKQRPSPKTLNRNNLKTVSGNCGLLNFTENKNEVTRPVQIKEATLEPVKLRTNIKGSSSFFNDVKCAVDSKKLQQQTIDKISQNNLQSTHSAASNQKTAVDVSSSDGTKTLNKSPTLPRNARNKSLKRKRNWKNSSTDYKTAKPVRGIRRKSSKAQEKEVLLTLTGAQKVDVRLIQPSFYGEQAHHQFADNSSSSLSEHPLLVGKQVVFVLNRKIRVGVLKFIGPTYFSEGEWCGIELNEPCGKNDGSVKGVRYFNCDENYGIFVHSHKVKELDDTVLEKIRGCKVSPGGLNNATISNSTIAEDPNIPQVAQDFVTNSLGNGNGSQFVNKSFKSNIVKSSLEGNFPFIKPDSGRMERSYFTKIKTDLSLRSFSYPKLSAGEHCFISNRGERKTTQHGSCPNLFSATSDQGYLTKAEKTNDVKKQKNALEIHKNFNGTDKKCNLVSTHTQITKGTLTTNANRINFEEVSKLNKTVSLNSFFKEFQDSDSNHIESTRTELPDNFLQEKCCSCPCVRSQSVKTRFESESLKQCFEEPYSKISEPQTKLKVKSNIPSLYVWQPPGRSLSLPKINVESTENLFLDNISPFHDSKTSSWPYLVKVKKIPEITYRSTDDEDDEFSVFPSKSKAYSVEGDIHVKNKDEQSSYHTEVSLGPLGLVGGIKENGCFYSRGQRSIIENCLPEGSHFNAESFSEVSGVSSQESLISNEGNFSANGRIVNEKPPKQKNYGKNGDEYAPKESNLSRIKSNHVKKPAPKSEIKPILTKPVQNKKGLANKKTEQNQQGPKLGSTKTDIKVKKRYSASAIPFPPKADDNFVQPGIVRRSSASTSSFESVTTEQSKMVSHIPHLMRKIQKQSEENKLQSPKLTKKSTKDEKKPVVSKQSKLTSVEKPFHLQKNTAATTKTAKPEIPKSSKIATAQGLKRTSKVSGEKMNSQAARPPIAPKVVKSSSFKGNREQLPSKCKNSREVVTQRPSVEKRGSSVSGLEKDTSKAALNSSSLGSVGKAAVKSRTTSNTSKETGALRVPKPVAGKKTAPTPVKGTDKKTKLSQDTKPSTVSKPLVRSTTKQIAKPAVVGKRSSKLRQPGTKLTQASESASVASSDGIDFISGLGSDIDSVSVNTDLSEDIQGLLHAHSISPEPEDRDFNEEFPFLGSHAVVGAATESQHVVKPVPWTKSVAAPDILSQISTQKSSVEVQTETEDESKILSDLQNRAKCMEELFKRKKEECIRLDEELDYRNWELIGIAVLVETLHSKLQQTARKVGHLEKKLGTTEDELKGVKEKCLEEEEENVKLQTEMMYVRSEHAVAIETLKADHDRMLEKMKFTLQMQHTEEMTLASEAHMAKLQDLQKQQEREVAKLKDEHEKQVVQVKEQYNDEIVEVESKHSNAVEEILEEHQVEIETIKSDYEEETEQLRKRCEAINSECTSLKAKLRQVDEDAQKDVESRIESAIAKYKLLPDELESLKVVLELKNEEIKQLRSENVETKMELEHLSGVGNRIRKLEHENESLSFVVENKSKMERQISVERDSLKNTLEREVKKVKRLSLENEELQWRLFHSPSPQPGLEGSDNSADNSRMNRLSTSSLDFSIPNTINE